MLTEEERKNNNIWTFINTINQRLKSIARGSEIILQREREKSKYDLSS